MNNPSTPFQANNSILTISQLNEIVKNKIEDGLTGIQITGEISNLSRPASGHLYFTLKDSHAQVKCAMFKYAANQLRAPLQNGNQVLVVANASLYEPRGDFQLIVNKLQLDGEGMLQVQFDILKKKLLNAGLLDSKHKRTIPPFPKNIGIITSPSGAAIQDILKTLNRRYPMGNIIIYPCLVQGKDASKSITFQISTANRRKECDIILLARGGGSLEDLWCFNEEAVANAIFESKIPIITGIGHETDTTIADFVADLRAATPTAAAELSTPDIKEWMKKLVEIERHLSHLQHQIFDKKKNQLHRYQLSLKHPSEMIQRYSQQLDQIEVLLHQLIRTHVHDNQQRIKALAEQLNTLNPLKTLLRGYTACYREDSEIVQSVSDIKIKQLINVKFHDGLIQARVEKLEPS